MKKLLPLTLFIFAFFSHAQESSRISNAYLHELITVNEEKSFINFDIDNADWRKNTVDILTSSDYKDPSFLKTAMVLHMLKYKLGDIAYVKSIDAYLLQLDQTKTTADIQELKQYLEDMTNVDLSDFFNDWFIGKGYPSYTINWFQNEDSHEISIMVKQKQSENSVSFFELPIPIKVSDEAGNFQFIRLEISDNKQRFTGYIPFTIQSVEIDPEAQIISANNKVIMGVDQEMLNTSISLYPNPAKQSINIQNAGAAVVEKISIFNMLGKLVLEETNPMLAINLKPLSLGMHLVKIETSQGTLHKTILKEQ